MTTHELMPLYYKSLFPYESMYRWLSYGHSLPTSSTDPKKAAAAGEKAARHANVDRSYFPRREFCFTLEGDIFVRYQSFKDVHAMKSAIRERVPAKIDIGPRRGRGPCLGTRWRSARPNSYWRRGPQSRG